jgi:predicted ATPase/DNA-binding CsgD family transcriptional regulator
LELAGEMIVRLDGLPFPDGSPHDADVLRYDSVRLFVSHARAVAPPFSLTRDNVGAVAMICAALEGSPLAIELAARLVRVLPPADILKMLGDRLALLVDRGRSAPPRQRDLRSAIRWSYELLSADEQKLFRRLAVLAGHFTLDDVAAICPELPKSMCFRLLVGLEAKSLAESVRESETVGRFRLLESVRLFAAEELANNSDESPATHDALITRLLALADPLVGTSRFYVTPTRLTPVENRLKMLEYVARWAAEHDDPRHLLLTVVLGRCWAQLGRARAAYDMLKVAIGSSGGSVPGRSAALGHAVVLALFHGDSEAARRWADEAVQLAEGEPPVMLARALTAQSWVSAADRDHDAEYSLARRVVQTLRHTAGPMDLALALHNAALAALRRGAIENASDMLNDALLIHETTSTDSLPPEWRHTAAMLALAGGNHDTAETNARAALTSLAGPRLPPAPALPSLLGGMAVVAARKGDSLRTLRLAAGAAAIRDTVGVMDPDIWLTRIVADECSCAAALLGETAAAQAHVEGTKATPEDLVTYAITDVWKDASEQTASTPLTAQQQRVAALVADGLTNRKIASDLHVSISTVDTHLRHIRERLNIRSRAQIIAWVLEGRNGRQNRSCVYPRNAEEPQISRLAQPAIALDFAQGWPWFPAS